MIYRKNVFKWEQGLRIVVGFMAAASPWFLTLEPAWLYVAMGLFFALTGVVGFCPACYMVGRRTPAFAREKHE